MNLESWRDALCPYLAKYPRLTLGVYAALYPAFKAGWPLAESFALQFAGPPACGKSLAVQMAASIWTEPAPIMAPSPKGGNLVVWDLCSYTPVETVISRVAGVVGRGKAAVVILDGNAPDPIPSHDHPLASRMITLWGSPLGGQTLETALDVDVIRLAIEKHHGVVGPAVAGFVSKASKNTKEKWRDVYHKTRAEYARVAGEFGGTHVRLASHLAGLAVTAELVHALLPGVFTWDFTPSIRDAWTWLCLSKDRTNAASYGAELVKQFLARNTHRLAASSRPGAVPPPTGFIGVRDDEASVIFVTHRWLTEFLEEEGLDPKAVFKEWHETGIVLPTHKTRGITWDMKIPGNATKVPCVGFSSHVVPS